MQNFRTVAVLVTLASLAPRGPPSFDSGLTPTRRWKLSGKVPKIYWSDPHVVVQLRVVDARDRPRVELKHEPGNHGEQGLAKDTR
jgi:hypothetical protein